MEKNVQIKNDTGLVLQISISTNKTDVMMQAKPCFLFKFHIDVFDNGNRTNILGLSSEKITGLVDKYCQFIQEYSFESFRKDTRIIGERSSYTKPSYLQALNIMTINTFNGRTIGRTLIELDADILTLLDDDILSNKTKSGYEVLFLHNINVKVANRIIGYKKQTFINKLSILPRFIKVFGVIWTVSLIALQIFQLLSADTINIVQLFPVILATAGPILYKYGTKNITKLLLGYIFKTSFG